MSHDVDRYTFQVVGSGHGDAYVGTVLEFPALSHCSTTAEGALAGIRQLVIDVLNGLATDGESAPFSREKHCPVPCLVCGTTMPLSLAGEAQPTGGVALHILGNYGSETLDPMDDANWLQAVLCDSCLRSAIGAGRILDVWRSYAIAPPPTYRIATVDGTVGIVDDPHLM